MVFFSTGRRRYGHPALNGVLPQPWLPLKKGQTLVNRETANQNGSSNEAVVLTLRKRYSSIRKGKRGRTISQSLAQEPGVGLGREGYSDAESTLGNPWSDLRTDERRASQSARKVNHRLSFDDASGVIILPEEAHWLMEDVDSDSEEDYGNDTTPSTSSVHENQPSSSAGVDGGIVTSLSQTSPVIAASPSIQRHGTYFHHPEKRRQTIPGAFPRS